MRTTSLAERWKQTRQRTLNIAALVSAEDACVQSMPDASPLKWHLAHTTWFFETFVLEAFDTNFIPFHPQFKVLFNSYYNGVGEKHPRAQRGLLTRPALSEILEYRHATDLRIQHLLSTLKSEKLSERIELGIQHEQQHQELMLTDIKHLLSCNPLHPALLNESPGTEQADFSDHCISNTPLEWHRFDAHLLEIGHEGSGFCFDNEKPRHRQFVEPFSLTSRLINNGEYLLFIQDGGYQNPNWWLAEGWDWLRQHQIRHPLYWHSGSHWQEFNLNGLQPLDMHESVSHLSYFEAAAYASWAGARLPTEAEWECAAQKDDNLHQLFDSCWQWTSSSYAPYPGFEIPAGAIGEYNGKFMVNQYVLRGSSSFTPPHHSRLTYRNFFPSHARWQRTGIRLARSISDTDN
ncbi:ergothioneine biosynthesis protein EgtB [Undibacterium sp. SXout11W]|uniref:ergothioneine biosynthesis protein EgtB n=1 Tax=Undibacterium sp. SXout11W TaxID=3413050 RepID=UPI003BF0B156